MNHLDHPNEITRESLVRILEIMHRLAAPEAMPELLREIIEVGKVAIVAETGVLWLLEKSSGQLVMVVPSTETPARLDVGEGWAGKCAKTAVISNIHECREDTLFLEYPRHIPGGESRSLLNVPIVGLDQSVLGVMQWLGAEVGQFDKHDDSFPGFNIDELHGQNFAKSMLEWNLPPITFKEVGKPAFYLSWARTALFAGVLATDIGDKELEQSYSSLGIQTDLHFTIAHRLSMTLSVGFAKAYIDGHNYDDEWMISLKIF